MYVLRSRVARPQDFPGGEVGERSRGKMEGKGVCDGDVGILDCRLTKTGRWRGRGKFSLGMVFVGKRRD